MFAKLFERITESSLMEEEIPVRYCFVMLLAIFSLFYLFFLNRVNKRYGAK